MGGPALAYHHEIRRKLWMKAVRQSWTQLLQKSVSGVFRVRWQELGYPSFSAYITGLIRYDLLVGGPHSSTTADARSKLQRKLTRKTLAAHRRGGRRKILLDHLIEEAEGHRVAQGELLKVKARIAQALRDISSKR